jgi:hypothetical protein
LKIKTGKNKDESSIAVAVDSLFAPGFSNQKPFTKMLMQPLQTENRQPGIEAEVQDNTDRLLAPQQLTNQPSKPCPPQERPLFAYFLGAWRKSRSPVGASPDGFITAP